MPRQLIPAEEQLTEKIQFRVTREINTQLQLIAKKKLRSKSYIICEAVEQYLKNLESIDNSKNEN
jgi:predicted DNA-binding protein